MTTHETTFGDPPSFGGFQDPQLRALAAGGGNFDVLAGQFLQRWRKVLCPNAVQELLPAGAGVIRFLSPFQKLYLRGFEDSSCWLLSPDIKTDDAFSPTGTLRELGLLNGESRSIFICLTAAQEEEARLNLPSGRVVVIRPAILEQMLTQGSDTARLLLAEEIRAQVHPLALQPFDTTRPVAGDMFFGRNLEMQQLLQQTGDNFLITGPSKIGKTSLLAHYRKHLRSTQDPRLARSFFINLQPCARWGLDQSARFFAMHFRSVPYTEGNLVFNELPSFLYSVYAKTGPFELILDEADALCLRHENMLVVIAEFARDTRSRLILVGRGALRQYWRKHQATALGRTRDIRFQSLGSDDAWSLFSLPMKALGLGFEHADHVRALVLRQTSRMPHLVQAMGRGAVEAALVNKTTRISPSFLWRHDTFDDFAFLRSHLEDLRDDEARLIATSILLSPEDLPFCSILVHEILESHGISSSSGKVADICDDLVINCLLGWENSKYSAPRWDIRQTANQNQWHIKSLQMESLSRIKSTRR